jgi:squamous cell carcinoma antigen recognized by T-cells 3
MRTDVSPQCGTINSFKLLPPQDNSTSAVIEFDNCQDAEFSLSRDQRDFAGQTIEVQLGGGCTIFVTNFPPEADEAWIRTSFSDVSVTRQILRATL